MCDSCKFKNENWQFKAGEKRARLKKVTLYGMIPGFTVDLKLCTLCERNLFYQGELKFIQENELLEQEVKQNRQSYCRVKQQAR
ncbi:hypothetical protein HBN50_03200 [Halobacteriovorax sp. GB3]|uniref:hypothetical protein n=1 Tax=Halobacteriovorax sp. GB3 TaxID=2719615 RepID=UPI002360EE17|nr:hypothetical protein [Halobacteriovorax sp. GB3]MDD0852083.1 hypothetical protein [Halobacteriovorax sp. GB3]